MEWYNKTPDQLSQELGTDLRTGLTSSKVSENLEKYGRNELQEADKKSMLAKIVEQFTDPMIIVLLVAAVLSGIVGEWIDSVIILAIVVLNAALSIYQEGKAEEALEALQKMASPTAKVIRDGKEQSVASSDLVPGDIVKLETGDIVPADLRLFDSYNLKIDESSLTGESVAVDKFAEENYEGVVEIGDRENMAYSSTIVSYGRSMGIVVDTGEKTEIGKIATSLASQEDEMTPLQKKLAQLSKFLGILVVGVCIIVFVVGMLYGHELIEMFLTSISLAVAAIPEGLPAIVTIVLSMGMQRIAENNAIVKKLLAVETLGTTTFICSDKTGTLTQNEMTVVKAFVDDKVIDISGTGYTPEGTMTIDGNDIKIDDVQSLYTLLNISVLTNDADITQEEGNYGVMGDPTEGALITFASKMNIDKANANTQYPRIQEIPFDSTRKMMSTFHNNFIEGKIVSFTKGAPDIILERCTKILKDGKVVDITEADRKAIADKNSEFASSALRVLSYAFKIHDAMPAELTSESIENEMIFVGLTGMIDPARPEAKAAIAECKSAGIVPVMITGDYLETAVAIAQELGIIDNKEDAIMGRELNNMSEEELREVVKHTRVFARVSPENKVQIVTALKQNGEITAMTGDGVNDAPAIKKADIGIAMGITGTDVAKNTAEVILTDDNFATIVNAVEEGRIIYSNIKKFVTFLLSANIGEVLVVLISILMNLPTPFIPIQLLWINLVTDSFPALALGVEKGDEDIMEQPPRDPNEPILNRDAIIQVLTLAVGITVGTLIAYYYALGHFDRHIESARTVAFATMITAELTKVFSIRSPKYTVFHIGFFSNPTLVKAVAFAFILMVIVIYVPFVQPLFKTIALGLEHWAVILPCALLPFVLNEARKAIFKPGRDK